MQCSCLCLCLLGFIVVCIPWVSAGEVLSACARRVLIEAVLTGFGIWELDLLSSES